LTIGHGRHGIPVNYVWPPVRMLLMRIEFGEFQDFCTSSGIMNTGALIFLDHPVYISNAPGGVGTTVIDA
jgi:hypothetical protein